MQYKIQTFLFQASILCQASRIHCTYSDTSNISQRCSRYLTKTVWTRSLSPWYKGIFCVQLSMSSSPTFNEEYKLMNNVLVANLQTMFKMSGEVNILLKLFHNKFCLYLNMQNSHFNIQKFLNFCILTWLVNIAEVKCNSCHFVNIKVGMSYAI